MESKRAILARSLARARVLAMERPACFVSRLLRNVKITAFQSKLLGR